MSREHVLTNQYTREDMQQAFEKWRKLDRSSRLGPEHDEEVKKYWKEYCKIRDFLAINKEPKTINEVLASFDME